MPKPTAPGRVTILDGGLATELEARGHDLSDRLWSARLLVGDPGAIEDVHQAYFRAGARVATTASYQATVPGFEAAGLDPAAALAAIRRSVEVARRARDRHVAEGQATSAGELLVAGSIGPYGAMLADGSEYRGDYDPGDAALRDLHAPRIEALLEAGADVLAIETIPTMREARVLVELVASTGARAWLSYQCRDGGSTASGEPIGDAVALADDVPGIVAVGVNCTALGTVPSLLRAARAATAKPLIAYPNDGDTWDAKDRRWVAADRDGRFDPAAVASWAGLGATWLGGCCGTGPSDIAALAAAVTSP
jgi:homocysteine S-methyltransferase